MEVNDGGAQEFPTRSQSTDEGERNYGGCGHNIPGECPSVITDAVLTMLVRSRKNEGLILLLSGSNRSQSQGGADAFYKQHPTHLDK